MMTDHVLMKSVMKLGANLTWNKACMHSYKQICNSWHVVQYKFNAMLQLLVSVNANTRKCECNNSQVQVKPLTNQVVHRNRLISGGIASSYFNIIYEVGVVPADTVGGN